MLLSLMTQAQKGELIRVKRPGQRDAGGCSVPGIPHLDPFQEIPEMLSALRAGLWAWGGQQLQEVKAAAASPDKSWALPRYGCGEGTERSTRYSILGVTCLGHAVPPASSSLGGTNLSGGEERRYPPSLAALDAHPMPWVTAEAWQAAGCPSLEDLITPRATQLHFSITRNKLMCFA